MVLRITKLKTLLARTHQANQRNLEEYGNLKRAQQEVCAIFYCLQINLIIATDSFLNY